MTVAANTFEQYRAMEGLNWSLLKHMGESPDSYLYHRDNPDADPDTHSRGALRAVHSRVLEGKAAFERDFVAFDGRRQGQAWEAALASAGSRTLLNPAELAMVNGASSAILRHPKARDILSGTNRELSIQWMERGRWMKGRLDACRLASANGAAFIVDLKAVPSTKPRPFSAEVARRCYHGQLAHYARGLHHIYGVPMDAITGYIVAYESKPPYDVAVYRVDTDAIFVGEKHRDALLDRLEQCEAAEKQLIAMGKDPREAWGPRETQILELILPGWAPGANGSDEGEEDLQWQE